MALDKSICSGKEHRKPYRGPKSVDGTCRNHGSCVYCRNGRMANIRKKSDAVNQKLKEFKRGNPT